jgi:imidazolonepropionase-like amidohydrolase
MVGFGSAALVELKTVPSAGGQPAVIAPPSAMDALFYMTDGRLGWTIPEPGSGGMFGGPSMMRIEAREADGKTTRLGSIKDSLGNVVLSHKGDGIFYSTDEKIRFFPFAGDKGIDLATLADGAAQLAVAANGSALFFGDQGKLWAIELPDGKPQRVTFKAAVTLEARKQVEPKWIPPGPGPVSPRAIVSPLLSPDQKRLVFMAAGFLYEQTLDGQPARRLFAGGAFERAPAFSPDGKRLAYAVSLNGQRELRVHNFATRQTRILYTVGGASWADLPSWSPDGTHVVFQRSDGLSDPYKLISIDLSDGKAEELAQTQGYWTARPHFSLDGRTLYFTARMEKYAALYRLSLQAGAKPEALTALTIHVNDGLISPDGKWLALRKNTEIWIAPVGTAPVKDAQLSQVTDDCSRSFSFTADSSAIIYAGGKRVWRQPLAGGQRIEIPVKLTLQRTMPAPLLLSHVRVLDFTAGRFGEETSLLIQDGKIEWIGSEQGHEAPKNTAVLDGNGRYVIPGLIDVHVHSAWANQLTSEDAFIAFGNTSVRDVGASLDLLNALRDRSETTSLPLPRYWYSGEILEGAMPLWGDAFLQIANEQEARSTIRKWKEWGSDLIKVYLTVPWHLQNIMAEEAQRQGLPLSGHAIAFAEMVRHALQGYASVEHSPAVMYEDGRKLMAAAGTRWVGTLTCEGGSEIFMREDPPIHMASELVRQFVPPDKIKAALKGGRLSYYPKEYWSVNMKNAFARIFAAYRDGVKVRAGTDALMAEVFFGLSLHWELEFFNMAGLSPFEVLRLGTADAAETVGAAAYLGSLAPGKLADMVILDANPLENIRNTIKIWRVIKDGQLFDPKALRPSAAAEDRGSDSQSHSRTQPPPKVEGGKDACLKCHGPFSKLAELTSQFKTPSGEITTPHRHVPHDSKDDKTITECSQCHQQHPVPPTAGDLAALKKPNLDFCYKCHHIKSFTSCKTCHPE